jgi:hypothetical protein
MPRPPRIVQKTRRPKPPAQATPGPAGDRRPQDPLSPEQEAQIWVLKEEDRSYRDIGREIGCSAAHVYRVLSRDPARLEALVTAAKERRAKLWEELENAGLKSSLRWIHAVDKLVFTEDGRVRRGIKPATVFQLAPRMIAAARLAGDSANRSTSALTRVQLHPGGGATITAGVQAGAPTAEEGMDADALIAQALELGPECVALLPERLRIYAERRQEKDHGP